MTGQETNEAEAIALAALGWTLADDARAARLLALTGLDADALRAGLTDASLLAAVLGFLEAHEPDLVACADALNLDAAAIVAARARLEA